MKFNLDVDEFIDPLSCNVWVATAVVGSAIIGAGASIYGANKASDAQTNAANKASDTSMYMYQKTRDDLSPFMKYGTDAGDELMKQLPDLTAPIDVTKEISDPNSIMGKAYNFNLTQGLKSTQNSAAARGLGVSGAALKGAAAFTTGLVDNTYPTLFNIQNTNKTNAYNRLKSLVDTGVDAAAKTGTAGTAAANTSAAAQIGAGNAQAAGYNAIGGAITNAANNIGGYAAYKGLYGGNSGGPSNSTQNAGDSGYWGF